MLQVSKLTTVSCFQKQLLTPKYATFKIKKVAIIKLHPTKDKEIKLQNSKQVFQWTPHNAHKKKPKIWKSRKSMSENLTVTH